MRITGPTGPTSTTPGTTVRRSGSGRFSLPDTDGPHGSSASGAARMLGGIDALLALQGVEDATERRRRAVVRGRSALDVLDEMKLALLAGNLDPAILARLSAIAAGLKETTGDPGLDGVLAEIELRVEVELAKLKPLGGV
ncbi:flagellar assembly protein FliX [Rhodoplanes azumiensis]|uniref:Flagellar assembly protein FliX n=1 Tax=Rhodoplanes azumiensis TaxID=1897628 RepID=A0ABW5APX8_9BRAD